MELEQVKDNTWVLKSWELIPVYRLDAHKCILLDTGLVEQREELQEALTNYGLEPVGVICSHAHIDHMGNVAYLKEKYGAKLAMSLGEAGHQMSYLGLNGGLGELGRREGDPLPGRPDHFAHWGSHHVLRRGV